MTNLEKITELDSRYRADDYHETQVHERNTQRRLNQRAEKEKQLSFKKRAVALGSAVMLVATISAGGKAMASGNKQPELNNRPTTAAKAPETKSLQVNDLQESGPAAEVSEPAPAEKVVEVTKPAPERPVQKSETKEVKTDNNGNVFNFEPQVWQGVKRAAQEHDLPVAYVTAIVQQESHGKQYAKSQDGFSSFGLMQPSLVYHFSEFAPALDKAGILDDLTSKTAGEIKPDDNQAMLTAFEQLSGAKQAKVTNVLCDIDVNLNVSCAYLTGELKTIKEKYPNLSQAEQLKLAAMAYNGGSSAPVQYMNGIKSPRIDNVKQYWGFVGGYYQQARASQP